MGHNSIRAYGEKVYLESGSWKCEKSPSGAHHWFILHFQMTCRHCGLNRQITDSKPELPKPHIN
jgi:hypothetical protein